jgi:hypothetical protein
MVTLKTITGCDDDHRIDMELDRLHALGLIVGGFGSRGKHADITATALALNMFVRCKGSRASALEYFKLSPP